MEALPFTIRNKPGEPGEITGICRLDDPEVVVEWRKTSLIKRHEKAGAVRVALSDLESVRFQNGWLRKWFIIRPRSLEPIRAVPGRHGSGELHLRISRRDRETASDLASSIDLALAEQRIDRLGRSIGL